MKTQETKPLLLDLFCGAGGCARGYADAGFAIVGVDLAAQKHYPYEFYQDDAMQVLQTLVDGGSWHGYTLKDFAVIHASPPCQSYSTARHIAKGSAGAKGFAINEAPMLVLDVYSFLRRSGVPWVIENVEGAPMPDAIMLCGSMFGLKIRRHRQFASSELLFSPSYCLHTDDFVEVVGGKVRGCGKHRSPVAFITPSGKKQRREGVCRKADAQAAMGIDWMTVHEMCEAIPPAYTRWIGAQLLRVLEVAA